MKNRTYRYLKGEPLYPFGYGLSYSTFACSALSAKRTAAGAEVRATVKNTSKVDGEEVVQLHVGDAPGDDAPHTQSPRIPMHPPQSGREPSGNFHGGRG